MGVGRGQRPGPGGEGDEEALEEEQTHTRMHTLKPWAERMRMSAGMRSPNLTSTMSPKTRSVALIEITCPSRSTEAICERKRTAQCVLCDARATHANLWLRRCNLFYARLSCTSTLTVTFESHESRSTMSQENKSSSF